MGDSAWRNASTTGLHPALRSLRGSRLICMGRIVQNDRSVVSETILEIDVQPPQLSLRAIPAFTLVDGDVYSLRTPLAVRDQRLQQTRGSGEGLRYSKVCWRQRPCRELVEEIEVVRGAKARSQV